jgi:uncharacterized membrane protein YhhN
LGAIGVLAAADWVCVARGWVRPRAITKTAVMFAAITGFSVAGGWQSGAFWFGLGLVLSLAGDTFLLFPAQMFMPGLVAFLMAHIAYIIGFNRQLPAFRWEPAIFLALILIADYLIYRRLHRAIMTRSHGRWIRFPVLIYLSTISLMLFSTLLTFYQPAWTPSASGLVIAGAFLFVISDSLLANNRFISPVRGSRVMVMVTYHLAQIAIVCGILLRY